MAAGFDVRPHLPTLRRYALVLARDTDGAEDLVQEALVRALAGAATWRGTGTLPWLLAILHNAHVDRRRRLAVEVAATRQVAILAESAAVPAPQPGRVHLSETMAALMRLPEEQRETLVLVAVEGLSYKEAAEIMGVPVGTLMSRLGRGREALRAAVGRPAGSCGAAGRDRGRHRRGRAAGLRRRAARRGGPRRGRGSSA